MFYQDLGKIRKSYDFGIFLSRGDKFLDLIRVLRRLKSGILTIFVKKPVFLPPEESFNGFKI